MLFPFFFQCCLPPGLGYFVGFLFCLFFLMAVRGSRLGQGLGLLLVGFLFIHLFHLHPPILKPDFDLPLGEVENQATSYRRSLVKYILKRKLLLQFQRLVLGVRAVTSSSWNGRESSWPRGCLEGQTQAGVSGAPFQPRTPPPHPRLSQAPQTQ